MPALNLDAAFVHLNLGDAHGNAAYTGIDPYFDDLFLMAADEALPVASSAWCPPRNWSSPFRRRHCWSTG